MGTRSDYDRAGLSRRDVLRYGALGAAAVACPALAQANVFPATDTALPLALGYWRGGAALRDFAAVRPGWQPACASRATCAAAIDEELSAATGQGTPGTYKLRVLGMANVERSGELRVQARFADTMVHDLWSNYRVRDTDLTASPVAMRWDAPAGEALPLRLSDGQGRTGEISLPAHAGVYVVLPGESAAHGSWRRLALRTMHEARPLSLALMQRGGTQAFARPYLLVTVDRIA